MLYATNGNGTRLTLINKITIKSAESAR